MSTSPTPTTLSTPSSTSEDLTASCTTATPGKYGNVPIDACNSYYNYNPEFAPAVAVAVLFGILLTVHIVEAAMFKKRYCWVLIMGAAWETAAFVVHALGAHDQQQIAYATAHVLLFQLAPLWINAFAYMTFSRMVYFFLPEKSVWKLKAQRLALWFVLADIVSFLIQGIGGVMATPGAPSNVIKTGLNILVVGMAVQQTCIVLFVGLMVVFQRRAALIEDKTGRAIRQEPWRPAIFAMYGVLICITVRVIFRMAEFAPGLTPSNPIPFHEAYSYALDATPMMIALLIYAIFHPGRTLVGPDSEFPRLSRKEKKALKQEKKAAKQAKKDAKRTKGGVYESVYQGNELQSTDNLEHGIAQRNEPRAPNAPQYYGDGPQSGAPTQYSNNYDYNAQYARYPARG